MELMQPTFVPQVVRVTLSMTFIQQRKCVGNKDKLKRYKTPRINWLRSSESEMLACRGEVTKSHDRFPATLANEMTEGDERCELPRRLRAVRWIQEKSRRTSSRHFPQPVLCHRQILVYLSSQWPPTTRKRLVRSRIDSYPSGREARAHAMLSHLVRL